MIVVGTGGHGQDLVAIARAEGLFVTAVPHHEGLELIGEPLVVGINDPQVRKTVVEALGGYTFMSITHPSAVVSGIASIGIGSAIGPAVTCLTGVHLGAHVHIGAGSHLTRCVIGDFTTVAPGVTICGDVTIGSGTLIGAGATVRNLVRIGSNVTVGAGAVVTQDVPDGATVKGVPAR